MKRLVRGASGFLCPFGAGLERTDVIHGFRSAAGAASLHPWLQPGAPSGRGWILRMWRRGREGDSVEGREHGSPSASFRPASPPPPSAGSLAEGRCENRIGTVHV